MVVRWPDSLGATPQLGKYQNPWGQTARPSSVCTASGRSRSTSGRSTVDVGIPVSSTCRPQIAQNMTSLDPTDFGTSQYEPEIAKISRPAADDLRPLHTPLSRLYPAEPPWYGPVCPVVREGRHRKVPPSRSIHVLTNRHRIRFTNRGLARPNRIEFRSHDHIRPQRGSTACVRRLVSDDNPLLRGEDLHCSVEVPAQIYLYPLIITPSGLARPRSFRMTRATPSTTPPSRIVAAAAGFFGRL